jgi:hypothetical protein
MPPIAITPDKVEIYPEKRGCQGDAPPGLLPPLGRAGFILQAAAENERIETTEDFNRACYLIIFLGYLKKRIRIILTYFSGCPGAFFKVPDPTGCRPENGHGFFRLVGMP